MRGRGAIRTVVLGTCLFLGALSAPAVAGADIIGPQNPDEPKPDSPWQAGTCYTDTPECNIDTPLQFFEQAAGHPPVGFTQFIVNHEAGPLPATEIPIGNVRTVRVDIPPGLTVNPQATPQCELAPEESPAECESTAPASQVGTSSVRATNPLTGFSQTLPTAPVYNIVPEPGEPARFGFSVLGNDVFLETDIEWEGDYHEYFTIHAHALETGIPGLEVARIAENRLVFDGTAGEGTFITTPTTCFGPAIPGSAFEHVYSTWLRADSFEEPDPDFPDGSNFVESKIPRDPPTFETSPKGCDSIPFGPSISVSPDTSRTDSPAGADVEVELPFIEDPGKEEKQGSSHVRSAEVTLPEGMGLNPSAANGLEACTDDEFGKATRDSVDCPGASKIGTVEVDSPPLPDGSLEGEVYVGEQLSRDPDSGDLYRIFVTVESSRYDISARLLGKIHADPETGQLTTSFDDEKLGKVPVDGLPQVPFESFRIDLKSGSRAPLTSPPTCDSHAVRTEMTPWSGNSPARPSDSIEPSSIPTGGDCPDDLEDRPFAPGFAAGTDVPKAGAFSPLNMLIARADGNQELKGVDVTLPPGLTAKLAGVTYCPEVLIATAGAKSGEAEAAAPSCPPSSRIGRADIAAGSGPSPLHVTGQVFLAGFYKGAPLSLAVITPATAGPFDLGSVVVRVALHVDPRTARVRALSDPVPHVYGGALLGIRSVAVRLDRPGFSLNPTGCGSRAIGGALQGGGGDPLDPADFSAVPVASPFFVVGCKRLGFRPKLFLRLFGAARRAKNPKLRAVVLPRRGDANIGRSAVILPRALILDQANLRKVCTRVQFAARACPRNSIYGWARAFSPLLDRPLQGPVYLRSSDNPLPDLVASLRGQVDVELAGRTDSVRGRIRNIFDIVPDVPVNKFILTLRGGRRGLLVNSRDLCPRKKGRKGARSSAKRRGGKRLLAGMRFRAHNGKKLNRRIKVRKPCGGKRGGKGRRGGRARR